MVHTNTPKKKQDSESCRLPPNTFAANWDALDIGVAVKAQNMKGSPGHDNLSVPMILRAGEALVQLLTELLNNSLNMGYFPKTWIHARIKTFLEKGPRDPQLPGSYRPTSLFPVLVKILGRGDSKQCYGGHCSTVK